MPTLTKEELLKDTGVKSLQQMKELIGQAQLTSSQFRELIEELIRLDVPVLEIGSSSIGKSYSIREMLEACGIRGEFLFVGTEKAEFIEGIPNLKAVNRKTDEIKNEGGTTTAVIKESVGEKFSYLKPYWFPSKIEIGNRMVNGRRQLELEVNDEIQQMWKYVKTQDVEAYKGMSSYGVLETLKFKLQDFVKDAEAIKKEKDDEKHGGGTKGFYSRYVFADAMMYISMLQGYGNFWLILDEIDKVSEQDKDKYAPLLHIVRERELKGWKLSGIRQYEEYDPKFVADITLRIKKMDQALDLFQEGNDIDLTDTRIIAIANDLRTLEKSSPALYRRFVKMIIDRTLYEEKEHNVAPDPRMQDSNPAKFYDNIRHTFNDCIVRKEVPKGSVGPATGGKPAKNTVTIAEDMAFIDSRLVGNPLDELNLQWTLGFIPDILFPGTYFDPASRDNINLIPNKIIENFNKENNPYAMYYYKILVDNFMWYYVKQLMVCANDLIGKKKESIVNKNLQTELDADELLAEIKDYNKPDLQEVLDKVVNRYKNQLKLSEDRFREIVEQQKGSKKAVKGSVDVMSTVFNTGKQKIKTGGLLILKSLKDNKPTKLTGLLMSSIPYIQEQFISSSPYISLETARQYQSDIESTTQELLSRLSNTTDDVAAMDKALGEIELNKEWVFRYGYGIDSPELMNEVEAMKPGTTVGAAVEDNKAQIIDKIVANRPVMMYDRLWAKLPPDLKKKYQQSISTFMMAEKEVLQNLRDSFDHYLEITGQTDASPSKYKEANDAIDAYIERYPFSMKLMIEEKFPIDARGYREGSANEMLDLAKYAIENKLYSPLDVIH